MKPESGPSAEVVMRLLAGMAENVGLATASNAKAIGFDLDGELWTLDPGRQGGILARGPVGTPALIVRCRPSFLLSLLTEDKIRFEGEDELRLVGDPSALQPLVQGLKGGHSLLSLLAARAKK
jgi:hypothetical protein